MEHIVISNDTLNRSKTYSSPVIVDEDNIVACSYYQLILINHRIKTEKLLFSLDGTQFGTIRYNKLLNKIFYTLESDVSTIHLVNLDGTGREDIAIVTQ